jgi:hypothetical protein
MAVGQRQRLYSGVRMFTGNYLSSTRRDLRARGVELELRSLIYYSTCPIRSTQPYSYSTCKQYQIPVFYYDTYNAGPKASAARKPWFAE